MTALRKASLRLRTQLTANAGCRPAVELLLPSVMLERIVISISRSAAAGPSERQLAETVLPLLLAAKAEALGTTSRAGGRRETAFDLAYAVSGYLLSEYTERKVIWCICTLTFWLKALLDSDYLELAVGSAGERGFSAVLEAVNDYPDLIEGMAHSAQKGARRLQERVEGLGLYKGARVMA